MWQQFPFFVDSLIRGTPFTLFQAGVQDAKDKRLAVRAEAAANAPARVAIITAGGADHANNQHLTWEQMLEGMKCVVTQLLPHRVCARVKRHLR